jgi:hypothetical protein
MAGCEPEAGTSPGTKYKTNAVVGVLQLMGMLVCCIFCSSIAEVGSAVVVPVISEWLMQTLEYDPIPDVCAEDRFKASSASADAETIAEKILRFIIKLSSQNFGMLP